MPIKYNNLSELLLQVAQTPQTLTFYGSKVEETISYEALYHEAVRVAASLKKFGCCPGDFVLFQTENNRCFVSLFWACLAGGYIAVPVQVGTNDEHRLKFFSVHRQLGNPFVVYDEENSIKRTLTFGEKQNFCVSHERVFAYEKLASEKHTSSFQPVQPLGDDLAMIQFSSGSTGDPKGVMLTHGNLLANLHAFQKAAGIDERDRFLSWFPLTHDMGLIGWHLLPLYVGADQILIQTMSFVRRPSIWFDAANTHRATILCSPNFGYRHYLKFHKNEKAKDWDLACVRLIFNGAEPISPSLCDEFLDKLELYGLKRESMYTVYGLAEATLAVAFIKPGERFRKYRLKSGKLSVGEKISLVDSPDESAMECVDVGEAIPGMGLRISVHGVEAEEGVVGHVEIRGACVTQGYYQNPEATQSVLTQEGWLDTGDIGCMLKEKLIIIGRAKDVIIIHGTNHYPHDIERLAEEVPGVELNKIAICGVRTDDQEEESLIAFVVHKSEIEGFMPLAEALREHLLLKVGLQIRHVLPVKNLPKTTSGKLQRYKLAQQFREGVFDEEIMKISKLEREHELEAGETSSEEMDLDELLGQLEHLARQMLQQDEPLDVSMPLLDQGFDSLKLVAFQERLGFLLKVELSTTDLFNYPTLEQLAGYLVRAFGSRLDVGLSVFGKADEPIAIVGIGCRLPGNVRSPEDFWRLLLEQRSCFSEVPQERWDSKQDFGAARFGAFVEEPWGFDPAFFGITPNEALSIDPQQRLLLECSYHALQDAWVKLKEIRDGSVGVYVGISGNDYGQRELRGSDDPGPYALTGTLASVAAGRIAYAFNLHGPAISLDTACSSSLVALHQAVEALRRGECSMALAGGVNLILEPEASRLLEKMGAISHQGVCRPFSDEADGYVRGEGCGMLLLKPLHQAEQDGDRIYACIKGSAINHDGQSNGLTAPNGIAQKNVIIEALQRADCAPSSIGYLEAHGTGTPLGDPIEAEALREIFKDRTEPLYMGAVKSNIGHLESAAGVAGVIKTALMLYHQEIPATLYADRPNHRISWEKTPLKLTGNMAWKTELPRRAGVSSFGFSGTNAHMILEEAPRKSTVPRLQDGAGIMPLSAKSPGALRAMLEAIRENMQVESGNWPEWAYAVAVGQEHHPYRLSVTASNLPKALEKIDRALEKQVMANLHFSKPPKTAMLFTGQGSQYAGMGKILYERYDVFRMVVDTCDKIAQDKSGIPLKKLWLDGNDEEYAQTRHTQPLLYVLEMGLAKLWQSWGIEPEFVIGHSIGEYAAASIAGIFTLEEGMRLVLGRAALMDELCTKGAMAVVMAGRLDVESWMEMVPGVVVSAVNAPKVTVVSGSDEAVNALLLQAKKAKCVAKKLPVSHAFHSPMMQPMMEAFRKLLTDVAWQSPQLNVISTSTSKMVTDEMSTPEYWVEQIIHPVLCLDALETLTKTGVGLALEVGPMAVLSGYGRQLRETGVQWVASLNKGDQMMALMEAVGALYQAGVELDWQAFYQYAAYRRLPLPPYPFEKTAYQLPRCGAKVKKEEQPEQNPAIVPPASDRMTGETNGEDVQNAVIAKLAQKISAASGLDIHVLKPDRNLFEYGLDSLVLIPLREQIKKEYGVEIPVVKFFRELKTLEKLAGYILEHGSVSQEPLPIMAQDVSSSHFQMQRQQVEITLSLLQTQMETMRQLGDTDGLQQVSTQMETKLGWQVHHPSGHNKRTIEALKNPCVLEMDQDVHLTPSQKKFIDALTERFVSKTSASKAYAAEGRAHLSDWIGTISYRHPLKGTTYPVVAAKDQGSRFTDLDGNEYIDICMGYGVSFFGHSAEFVKEAVKEQIDLGFGLAPQTPLAAEVAKRISQMTGVERVCFSNTGTESVMAALRIARAVSGRTLVAKFKGSFHGTFDGVLVTGDKEGCVPATHGVTPGMAEDVVELDYGSETSLEYIRNHGDKLAAVLCEPVQSRRLNEVPDASYLRQLRILTKERDVALIFDEMITGFRLEPGGAQAYFGVQADIVTYGKIIGGGMPIGVVAGAARYLDAVDGGAWQYGDDSYPQQETTVFGGTFCKHPLSMAAALAVLQEIDRMGKTPYQQLNERTRAFADELNRFFEIEKFPLRVMYFASFFRLEGEGVYRQAMNPIELELLFHLLMDKGVYTWEKRVCCFSLAHTSEEIALVLERFKAALVEMRENGFFVSLDAVSSSGEPHQYMATSPQQRLFVLSSLEQKSNAYLLVGLWKIAGSLDEEKLQQALDQLTFRHESLRTAFSMQPEGLIAQVKERVHLALERRVLLENENLEAVIDELVRPFDLNQAPLMRTILIENGNQEKYLVIYLHHTVFDGYSTDILIRDLVKLYDGEPLEGTTPYHQYALLASEWDGSEPYRLAQTYWESQYRDIPAPLELPLDLPRPKYKSFSGGCVSITLASSLQEELEKLCQLQESLPNNVLLTFYLLFLHKLTGQEEVVVGIPVMERGAGDFSRTIGMFVDTLPVRFTVDPKQGWVELLKHVDEKIFEALEYSRYPLEKLISSLELQTDMGRNPLFDTMFSLEQASSREVQGNDFKLEGTDYRRDNVEMDISLEVTKEHGCYQLDFYYDDSLLEETTIRRWSSGFVQLFEEASKKREHPLINFSLVTPEEQGFLNTFNQTDTLYPDEKTLKELFEEQVEKTPEQKALQCDDITLTYQELNAEANRLARYLQKQNVGPDTLVGVCMERSEQLIIAILGILKAGGAYLPIDPSYPEERIAYMLEDAAPRLTLCDAQSFSFLQRLIKDREHTTSLNISGESFLALPHADVREESSENLPATSTSVDLAYVIYTSGSTGKPKGVMIEQRGVMAYLSYGLSNYLKKGQQALSPFYTPIAFDLTVTAVWIPLVSGGCVNVLREEQDVEKLLNTMVSPVMGLDFLKITPMHLEMIGCLDLTSFAIQAAVVGGEALTWNQIENIRRLNPELSIYNEYGPTEATVGCVVWKVPKDYQKYAGRHATALIGSPIANTRIHILDSHLQTLPIGIPGELHIAGAGLARGYLNRPELTKEKFIDHSEYGRLYKTGDLGRWLEDGNIEFLGRIDDQVKVRGFRIELGEIEQNLLSHPEVQSAVVLVKGESDKQLIAYCVSQRPSLSSEEEQEVISSLRFHLQSILPEYMVPSFFILLESFPLTPNGKVDKKKLLEMKTAKSKFTAPKGEREQLLCFLYETVLRSERVGAKDGFFTLGGDSIKAIQLAARLREQGYKLEIRDLFAHPTPRSLAPHMIPLGGKSVRVEERATAKLSPIQHWFLAHYPKKQGREWFNQSLFLRSKERVDLTVLKQALQMLVSRHSALRLRIREEEEEQYFLPPDEKVVCDELDVRREADPQTAMRQAMEMMQQMMDPHNKPPFRAVLIHAKEYDYIYLVAHHIAVDGVSWRILLEDLQSAYGAMGQGAQPELLAQSDGYGIWCDALWEYAADFPQSEALYWQKVEANISLLLPEIKQAGNFASAQTIKQNLGAQESAMLLGSAHEAYGTGPEDLLLVALSRALHTLFGNENHVVALEGHGRTPLSNLEISRTVGWFTALYPASLPWHEGIEMHVKMLKEALRAIPRKGSGYGIYRWLAEPEGRPKALPQLLFNFLGAFESHSGNGPFVLEDDPGVPHVDPKALRTVPLDFECMAQDGVFHAELIGDGEHLPLMQRLMETFMRELSRVLNFCATRSQRSLTPSDTDDPSLPIEELDRLLDVYLPQNVANVHPLTPLQEGIWLHALSRGETSPYFEQIEIYLDGKVDPKLLQQALDALAVRHEMLRSRINTTSEGEPRQIILHDDRLEFCFQDWQMFDSSERHQRLQQYKSDDLARYFDLLHEPPLRIALFQMESHSFLMLWSAHHVALDGWSMPVLMDELVRIYSALREGGESDLPEARPFSSYVRWLWQYDRKEALRFWEKRLEGFSDPTSLPSDFTGNMGYEQGIVEFELDEPTNRGLEQVAREAGTTPSVLAQALWGVLLARWNGTADVVFAATVSGRPGELDGVERICGLFINAIPVRIQMEATESFSGLLQRLGQEALEAQIYHYGSLAEIQAGHPLRRKLLDHILVYENYPFDEAAAEILAQTCGFHIRGGEAYEQTNYDLDVTFLPNEKMGIRLKYNQNRYAKATMARIEEELRDLASLVLEEPNSVLSTLGIKVKKEIDKFPVVIASTFTDVPLKSPLQWWSEHTPFALEADFAPYATLFRELSDANGVLSGKEGVRVLLVRFEDWLREREGQEVDANIDLLERSYDEFIHLLGAFPAEVSFFCPLVPVSEELNPELSGAIKGLQRRYRRDVEKMTHVNLLDWNTLTADYGISDPFDALRERQGHIPYSDAFYAAMAAEIVRVVLSHRRAPYKVIALDCDHTLWQGIIGEDGIDGIVITEAHAAFQDFLIQKVQEGFLLVLLSKNNEEDVWKVFEECSGMHLKKEHVTAHGINWEPKSANLRTLMTTLNLGLSSVLFLDDNPAECEAMRQELPEVLSFQFPTDESSIRPFIRRLWMLDKLKVTAEDAKRTAMYRSEMHRQSEAKVAPTLESFLENLELKVSLQQMEEEMIPRLSQLMMRTNQFNFTTIRRDEAAIRALMDEGVRVYAIWVEDRFGSYGLSGVLAVKAIKQVLEVDTFLLSCRVLGRGVEGAVFGALRSIAREIGVQEIHLPYRNSGKNVPAKKAAEAYGWDIYSEEETVVYQKNLDALPEIPDYVTLVFGVPDRPQQTETSVASAISLKASVPGLTSPNQNRLLCNWELPSEEAIRKDHRIHYLPLRYPDGESLRKMAERQTHGAVTNRIYTPPQGILEEGVARVFEEVLGIDQVGADEDFFILGGHSLQATRVLARLFRDFGIEIGLDRFFAAPNPRALAQALEKSDPDRYGAIPPVPAMEDYPLSHAQRRFWVLQKMEKHFSAYHLSGAFRILGVIDEHIFVSAWSDLLLRHEILRSRILENPEGPRLKIAEESQVLECVDLSGEKNPEAKVQVCFQNDVDLVFDLENESPIRAKLYRLGDSEYLFTLVLHHVAADGWSAGVLARDLSALYSARTQGVRPNLLEIPISYPAFALWQEKLLAGETGHELKAWWHRQLAGAPYIELPLDYPRPVVQRFEGGAYEVRLNAEVIGKMRELAREERVGAFAPFLTTLYILLFRYTAEEDMTVGTASAGRIRTELENGVGCYANTLALRTRIHPDWNFRECLRVCQETITQAQVHQLYPFDALVDELGLARDVARPPLFDVMAVLQNADEGELHFGEARVEKLDVHERPSPFGLTFMFYEDEAGFALRIEYATALFQADRIKRIASHFCVLLVEGVNRSHVPLKKLELLTESERESLLRRSCMALPPMCAGGLWQWFDAIALGQGERIAVSCGEESWSYDDLRAHAEKMHGALSETGISAGSCVATFLPRSLEWVAALLGIWRAGCVYVPVDPDYPEERIVYMFQDSGATVAFADEKHRAKLPQGVRSIPIDSLEESGMLAPVAVALDDTAYVIYTSGSTGTPKGAVNLHRGMLNTAAAQIKTFGVQAESVVLQFAAASFDASLSELCMALFAGAALAIATRAEIDDLENMERFLSRHRVSVATFPPHYLAAIRLPETMKTVITAGEPPILKDARELSRQGILYFNAYGPSECAICASIHRVDPSAPYPLGVPIGTPVEGGRLYVLDKEGNLQPEGVPGEIVIGGAGVGSGYLGLRELTGERFGGDSFIPEGRIYRTGDLGRWDEDELLFLGRIDTQIKIRGYRIEPGEIESRLRQEEGVEDCVVEKCGEGGAARLVAFIVGEKILSEEVLRHSLSQQLPGHMVPDSMILVGELPQSASGKIDRKVLCQSLQESADKRETHVAPRNANEMMLCRLWSEITGVDKIGIEDDFFMRGGNSLRAILALSRIQKSTGKDFPLASLYTAPTPAAFAKLLETGGDFSSHPFAALNAEGCQETWVCLPPMPGIGSSFQALADRLEGRVSLYAVDVPDTDDPVGVLIEALFKLPISQPYRIVGYSGGGNLGFEMARKLEERGGVVQLLVLLDSYRRISPLDLSVVEEERLLVEMFETLFDGEAEAVQATLRERGRSYLRYLNRTVTEGVIQAPIHVIFAHVPELSSAEYEHCGLSGNWSDMSVAKMGMVKGKGNHREMLAGEALESNLALLIDLFSVVS